MTKPMPVERRDANVVFVSFNQRPPAVSCDACPFRRCCTCAHWSKATQSCFAGRQAGACSPATEPDDWCGEWEAREIELVGRSNR